MAASYHLDAGTDPSGTLEGIAGPLLLAEAKETWHSEKAGVVSILAYIIITESGLPLNRMETLQSLSALSAWGPARKLST